VSATRFPGKKPSPYKIEGVGGRFIGGSRKTSSCLCGLNSVARRGEPDQKIRRHSGTPRGRRHAATSADLLIPSRKGGLKCSRVGGGCIAMMRGGDKTQLDFMGAKGVSDVEFVP